MRVNPKSPGANLKSDRSLRPLYNTSSTTFPHNAIVEVVSFDPSTGRVKVKMPSADGINPARLLVTRGTLHPNSDGMGAMIFPQSILFNDAATPATGEAWGTQSGTYRLKQGKFGFRAIEGVFAGATALFIPDTTCQSSSSGYSYSYDGVFTRRPCCNCERFLCGLGTGAFPATIDATITVGCIGTRTITLTRQAAYIPPGPLGIAGAGCESENYIKIVYQGSYVHEVFGGVDFINTLCNSSTSAVSGYPNDEELYITLRCLASDGQVGGVSSICKVEEPASSLYFCWLQESSWFKVIAGQGKSITSIGVTPVLSCTPFSLSTGSRAASCTCDTSTDLYCGPDPVVACTTILGCSGTSTQTDFDE